MCDIGFSTNSLRLTRKPVRAPDHAHADAMANLLATIMIDGTAANRWLTRDEANIDEARCAIDRVLAHARLLAQALNSGIAQDSRHDVARPVLSARPLLRA